VLLLLTCGLLVVAVVLAGGVGPRHGFFL